jgi:ElaB/YqjD/DUF883 family membrane-anchored ribosome-binding protein
MSGDTAETRTPEQIRRDIEHTREGLAETAAALAEKADVKARAHEKLDEAKARVNEKLDTAKAKVSGTAHSAKDKASDATPATVSDGAQSAAVTAQAKVKANPIPSAAVAGFAAGVLIGWIVAARRS